MLDYSIELQAENIYNHKTKEYFQEVLSSYINGNYRSALVMLWTVTITDLVFKLQDLSNIYEDETAEEILKEIEDIQNNNPTSAQWESELIKLIRERTKLFAQYELTHVEALQKQRHLSAHPIIKEAVELYQPNKETVRAAIRNILEYVLTKPPYASVRLFDVLIEDISQKRELFPEYENLVKYIEAAYLKNMPLYVIKSVYKKLWKFAFQLQNEEANKNREINVRVLGVLIEKYDNQLFSFMQDESEYFGRTIDLSNDRIFDCLLQIMNKYPKLFTCISNTYQSPIKEKINSSGKWQVISLFLHESPEALLEALGEVDDEFFYGSDNNNSELLIYFKGVDREEEIYNKFIDVFSRSGSYNSADIIFHKLIEPYLEEFSKENIRTILNAIESNDQIYGRGRAESDNKKVYEVINERFEDEILLDEFSKFSRSL